MLLVGLGFETYVPAIDFHRKDNPIRAELFFHRFSSVHNQAVKFRKREIADWFSTAALRFDQRVIDTFDCLHIVTNISTGKL